MPRSRSVRRAGLLPLTGVFKRHGNIGQALADLVQRATAIRERGNIVGDGVHDLKEPFNGDRQIRHAVFEFGVGGHGVTVAAGDVVGAEAWLKVSALPAVLLGADPYRPRQGAGRTRTTLLPRTGAGLRPRVRTQGDHGL
jgi:hypothetical protein